MFIIQVKALNQICSSNQIKYFLREGKTQVPLEKSFEVELRTNISDQQIGWIHNSTLI